MAERWSKAIEALKASFSDESSKTEKKLKPQEKIHHMSTISELVCSPPMRSSPDFLKNASATLDALLRGGCDDANSSVRLNANEFLNKLIKTLTPFAVNRILWDLFREIKRNGSAKCVKAALSRFADLCHLIKSNKLRAYINVILPCLARMTKRDDEVVQESLTTAMAKLCPTFCPLMTDGEYQSLTKNFLAKLSSPMTTARRMAATSIGLLCHHAENPPKLIHFVVGHLLNLSSSSNGQPPSIPALNGVLMCCRHVTPVLTASQVRQSRPVSVGDETFDEVTDRHVHQLYALMLRCTNHPDSNVVTTALESLHALLASPPAALLRFITTPCLKAPSVSLDTDALPTKLEETIIVADDDDNVVDENEPTILEGDDEMDAAAAAVAAAAAAAAPTEIDYEEESPLPEPSSEGELSETVEETEDAESESIVPESPTPEPELKSLDDVTSTWDENEDVFSVRGGGGVGQVPAEDMVPLVRCVRRLCSMFLLSGERGQILDERARRRVRVSVKALALKCVAAALSLYPSVFFLPVTTTATATERSSSSDESRNSVQYVDDVLLYVFHSDQVLRGETAALVGKAISAFLQTSRANYQQWESKLCDELKRERLPLSQLVRLLVSTLLDEPPVCKVACSACKQCLNLLLSCSDARLGLDLLRSLLKVKSSTYWLVKVELAESLAIADYRLVSFLQNQLAGLSKTSPVDFQRQTIEVLLEFLQSDDGRVRQAAADAFVNVVPRLFYAELDGEKEAMLQFASSETVLRSLNVQDLPFNRFFNNQLHPFLEERDEKFSCGTVKRNLSRIVALLTSKLTQLRNKHFVLGCCRTLAQLANTYPPHRHPDSWSSAGQISKTSAAPLLTPRKSVLRPSSPMKPSPSPQKTPGGGGSPRKGTSSTGESGKSGLSLSISFPLFKLPVKKASPSVTPSAAQAKITKSVKADEASSLLTTSEIDFEKDDDAAAAAATSQVHYDGPLAALLCLMTSSPIALDLIAQKDMLTTYSRLIFSRGRQSSSTSADSWSAIQDKTLVPFIEEYFVHLMRILRVIVYVVEKKDPQHPEPSKMKEKLLGPLTQVGSGVLTPRKKSMKTPEKETPGKGADGEKTPGTPSKTESDGSKESQAIGWFSHLSLYCSLWRILKGVYANHQTDIDETEMTKFFAFLKASLESLALLVELAGLSDIGKMAEELTKYLHVCTRHCPGATFLCLEKLLNALFGANTAGQRGGKVAGGKSSSATKVVSAEESFYSVCFSEPEACFEAAIERVRSVKERYDEVEAKRNQAVKGPRRRVESFLFTGRPDITPVMKYIGLFEPLVIRAMKMYAATARKHLQKRVLVLLIQLVRLRVNYSMLDSEQAFLRFIYDQLEKADEGYFKGNNDLLLHAFHFLTLLSNSRQRDTVVTTSRVLQLSSGLMASLQDSDSILSALKPVVSDLFLARQYPRSSGQLAGELEAQQDVVLSLLARLINHHEAILLIVTVLDSSSRLDGKKWRERSVAAFEALQLKISSDKYCVTEEKHFLILNLLFASFSPSCFRPADRLFYILLREPPVQDASKLLTWLALFVATLEVALAVLPGQQFVDKFQSCCETIERPWWMKSETNSKQQLLTRFLLGIVSVLIEAVHSSFKPMPDLFYRLLYRFLIVTSLLFKRDLKQAVLTDDACESLVKDLSARLFLLLLRRPMLVVGWCAVTAALGYHSEWWDFLMTPEALSRPSSPCDETKSIDASMINDAFKCTTLSMQLVQTASLVFRSKLLCEVADVFSTASESVASFVQNYSLELCLLSDEPPVETFLRSVSGSFPVMETFIRSLFVQMRGATVSFQLQHCVLATLSRFEASPRVALLLLPVLTSYATFCKMPTLLRASSKLAARLATALQSSRDAFSPDVLQTLKDRLVALHAKVPWAGFDVVGSKLKALGDYAGEILAVNPDLLGTSDLEADYYRRVLTLCTSADPSPCNCALLLHALSFRSCLAVMEHQSFSLVLLKECIRLGCEKTAVMYHRQQDITAVDAEIEDVSLETGYFDENGIDHLLHAAQTVLLQKVSTCVSSSTKPGIVALAGALAEYLHSLRRLPKHESPPASSLSYLANFTVDLLQWTAREMRTSNRSLIGEELLDCLTCAAQCLENRYVLEEITKGDHSVWSSKAVESLFKILTTVLCDTLDSKMRITGSCEENLVEASSSADTDGSSSGEEILRTAKKLSALLDWSHDRPSSVVVPFFLRRSLRSLIASVCRLPALEAFARTPPILWADSLSAGKQPIVTADDLIDEHIFREHMWRVLYLGWRNRQQFEETWVSFLAVVSPPEASSTLPADELAELYKISRLSVQAITALLLQTTLAPVGGHPQTSRYCHEPRHRDLPFLGSRPGRRLQAVQSLVKDCTRAAIQETLDLPSRVKRNVEKRQEMTGFCSGLVNITTLQVRVVTSDVVGQDPQTPDLVNLSSGPMAYEAAAIAAAVRNSLLVDAVDVRSCLRFILDQFNGWLERDQFPLVNIYDTIRSAVVLSDVFEEKWHFDWLMEHCQRYLSSWPAEDENLFPYLVLGLCKAAAVQRNNDHSESLTKTVLSGLISSNPGMEMMTLSGILYLLESHSGVDFPAVILPLCDYIITQLTLDRSDTMTEKLQLLLWTTAFFIMEHYQDEIKTTGFAQKIFKNSCELLADGGRVSIDVYHCVSDSVERLALLFNLNRTDVDLASKIGMKSLVTCRSAKAASCLNLVLSCLYTGKTTDRTTATTGLDSDETDVNVTGEKQLVALEKITGALRRMHKGFPSDGKLIAAVLPSLFEDFIPLPQTVMTKVFGEFLSSQQPYPQYIAEVLFLVFGRLMGKRMGSVIKKWVVLSLSSFIQRSPFSMALWSLNCLFTSASSDKWLRARFPRLLERIGSHSEEEEYHLFIAVKDFCVSKTLLAMQQESFVSVFKDSKERVFRNLADFIETLWKK